MWLSFLRDKNIFNPASFPNYLHLCLKQAISAFTEYLCDHLSRAPIVAALISQHENLDTSINWNDVKMKLPRRSGAARKAKWYNWITSKISRKPKVSKLSNREKLKEEFRAAREQLQPPNDRLKDVLRKVLPEDTRLIAMGRSERHINYMKPEEHAKWVDLVREYCEEREVQRTRDIDKAELKVKWVMKGGGDNRREFWFNYCNNIIKRLESADSPLPFQNVWKRLRLMLFVSQRVGLFRMLPIDEDKLSGPLIICCLTALKRLLGPHLIQNI